MAKTLVQDGSILNYANAGSAIASGAVVASGHSIGIALVDIAATTGTGSVDFTPGRVYTVPKVTGAVFVQGEKLLWDVSAGKFDDSAATPATGDIMGAVIAAAAGADGETTCQVMLTPGNATKT